MHGHAHEISDAWPTLVETVDNVEVVEVVGVVDVRKVSQVGKSGRSGRFCLVWFGLNQTPHIFFFIGQVVMGNHTLADTP